MVIYWGVLDPVFGFSMVSLWLGSAIDVENPKLHSELV